MLEPLSPGRVNLRPGQFIPPFLAALIAAAAEGRELLPFVSSVTAHLGFNSFMYAASAMPKPDHEEKAYVYTTLPLEWIGRYDQMAYVEVDPRIFLTWAARSRWFGIRPMCGAWAPSPMPFSTTHCALESPAG